MRSMQGFRAGDPEGQQTRAVEPRSHAEKFGSFLVGRRSCFRSKRVMW